MTKLNLTPLLSDGREGLFQRGLLSTGFYLKIQPNSQKTKIGSTWLKCVQAFTC